MLVKKGLVPVLLSTSILLLGWWLMSEYLLSGKVPTVGEVVGALRANPDTYSERVGETLVHAGRGLIWAVILAVLVACVFSMIEGSGRLLYPLLVALKATPVVALLPLVYSVLGYDIAPIVFVAFFISFFPLVLNAQEFVRVVPEELEDCCQVYGASRRSRFAHVVFPYLCLGIAAGLRISAPLSVVGAVTGEYLVRIPSAGLGYELAIDDESPDKAGVYAAAVLSVVCGLLFFLFATLFQVGVRRRLGIDAR